MSLCSGLDVQGLGGPWHGWRAHWEELACVENSQAGGDCNILVDSSGDTGVWNPGSSSHRPTVHKHRALTTGWNVGTKVDGKSMALAQVGVMGQCSTQARLPTAAGVLAALLEVGHGAQVCGAGREQLPHEHAAGLHGVGG